MKRLKDMKRPEDTVKPEPPSQATALHEDIYTIPNLLTLSRLVAAPFIGYFVLHEQHALALGLFVYAGVSDLVDGYVARRWNKKTVVGSVIDPMADKTLMTILTICLAVKGALPGMNDILLFPPDFLYLPTYHLEDGKEIPGESSRRSEYTWLMLGLFRW